MRDLELEQYLLNNNINSSILMDLIGSRGSCIIEFCGTDQIDSVINAFKDAYEIYHPDGCIITAPAMVDERSIVIWTRLTSDQIKQLVRLKTFL